MPVADHPIHPSTIQGADARYGCVDRPLHPKGYYAPNRVYVGGSFFTEAVFIPHRFSVECHHPTEPKCGTCEHRIAP